MPRRFLVAFPTEHLQRLRKGQLHELRIMTGWRPDTAIVQVLW